MKKNKYSKCYFLLTILAGERNSNRLGEKTSNEMSLMILILKEKFKKEFGIKSLRDLDSNKKIKEFEDFLNKKL